MDISAGANKDPILRVNNVSIVFGGLRAVSGFTCDLYRGELAGLIGPNGAGKTTIFNMLSGIYTPASGEITFYRKNGRSVRVGKRGLRQAMPPSRLARAGIARTFQNIRLFGNLSAIDNVRIALHQSRKVTPVETALRLPRFFRDEKRQSAEAENLLDLFGIAGKKHELAKNLPYGEQRKLEIARALALSPELLLLDEPAAGMNPQETEELMGLITRVRKTFRLTILLIEHDMRLVMGICERLMVLDYGALIAHGTPEEIRRHPAVIKAYLGETVDSEQLPVAGCRLPEQFPVAGCRLPVGSDIPDKTPETGNRKPTTNNQQPTTATLLTVKDLSVHYGTIQAIKGISFDVGEGEIITLIGANGAGKTSTMHALSGIIKKSGGQVIFDGADISAMPPDKIVRAGLIQSPEGRRIFANLTVRENLEMGAFTGERPKVEFKQDIEQVYEIFPRLRERVKQYAGTLSGGEQQMLAIGRSLMARPRLLLLDEPSMGLAPILVDEIFSIIKKINAAGTTVLLVEQNAYKALGLAVRAYILETGRIVKSGSGAELLNDSAVQEAYLGG
jgi:branched-chain amino acid transport system ATP-binding protein